MPTSRTPARRRCHTIDFPVCLLIEPFRFVAAIIVCVVIASEASPGQTSSPVRVRITYSSCITEENVWQRGEGPALAQFMRENPDIEVVPQRIPFESYDTQVMLAAKGGHPPDVGRVNHSTMRAWAGAGYLLPLDDLVARSKTIDVADYWPGFWQIGKIDGKQFAIPLGTDCRVLFYHLPLFRKAGLSAPRTWPELIAAAKKIQDRANHIYGIALPSDNEWSGSYEAVGVWMVANGGFMINEDGTRAVVGKDAAAREAFRFACELSTVHRVCPPGSANINRATIETLFVNGRLGMMISGPWQKLLYERIRPDFKWRKHYEMALIPAAPSSGKTGSAQGGWLMAAFKSGQHPEAAMRLIEFLSRPEVLAGVCAPENLPPRRAAIGHGPFREPFYQVFFDELPHSRPPYAVVPQLPSVARVIQRAYQRVVSGAASVDDALGWLDERLTNHVLR